MLTRRSIAPAIFAPAKKSAAATMRASASHGADLLLISQSSGGQMPATRRPYRPEASEPCGLAGPPVGVVAAALRAASGWPHPVAWSRACPEPRRQQSVARATQRRTRPSAAECNAGSSSGRVCRGNEGCPCAGIGGRVRAVRALRARQLGTARAFHGIAARVRAVDQAASRPGLLARHSLLFHGAPDRIPVAEPRSITANPSPMKTDRYQTPPSSAARAPEGVSSASRW